MRYSESFTSKPPNNVAALHEAARQFPNPKKSNQAQCPAAAFLSK